MQHLIVLPPLYHSLASAIGGKANYNAGFSAQASVVAVWHLAHAVGSLLMLPWPMAIRWWQIFVWGWCLWIQIALGQTVYGLPKRKAVALGLTVVTLPIFYFGAWLAFGGVVH